MSVPYIPARAKPPVNSVAANAKRKGEPSREWEKPRIPKKEIRSSARDELAMLRSKTKHCQLVFHRFRTAFSGLNRVLHLAWGGIFFDFYFANFAVGCFERANKITIM